MSLLIDPPDNKNILEYYTEDEIKDINNAL